mmetsp:Transcript_44134/g.122767  ORF Transcript_44134/g.122767 Transcript_44134/m.122767 type:complete len:201 (-) Transcript_44134:29-631(-)
MALALLARVRVLTAEVTTLRDASVVCAAAGVTGVLETHDAHGLAPLAPATPALVLGVAVTPRFCAGVLGVEAGAANVVAPGAGVAAEARGLVSGGGVVRRGVVCGGVARVPAVANHLGGAGEAAELPQRNAAGVAAAARGALVVRGHRRELARQWAGRRAGGRSGGRQSCCRRQGEEHQSPSHGACGNGSRVPLLETLWA